MPVLPGESIDPERTRQRIMAVCDAVFTARGIQAVGMNDIAEATRASKASIYKNFGSKDGLVSAVLSYRSRETQSWLRSVRKDHAPGVARILAVFDLLLEWFGQVDFRGCPIVNAAAEERVSGAAATVVARNHLTAYRDFLREELTAVGISDPTELATQLLVLIEGATVVSSIEGDPSVALAARRCAALLLEGSSR